MLAVALDTQRGADNGPLGIQRQVERHFGHQPVGRPVILAIDGDMFGRRRGFWIQAGIGHGGDLRSDGTQRQAAPPCGACKGHARLPVTTGRDSMSMLLAAASAAHGFRCRDGDPRPISIRCKGAARAKSDSYFEGGYWLPLWAALVSILVLLADAALPLVGGVEQLGQQRDEAALAAAGPLFACLSPSSAR